MTQSNMNSNLNKDFEFLVAKIRMEERQKLLDEGYILKKDCPASRESDKIRELKKANKSLQRNNEVLRLEIETMKMMGRW